jgi:hypothetical protein
MVGAASSAAGVEIRGWEAFEGIISMMPTDIILFPRNLKYSKKSRGHLRPLFNPPGDTTQESLLFLQDR